MVTAKRYYWMAADAHSDLLHAAVYPKGKGDTSRFQAVVHLRSPGGKNYRLYQAEFAILDYRDEETAFQEAKAFVIVKLHAFSAMLKDLMITIKQEW